jgi:hypothetical protein
MAKINSGSYTAIPSVDLNNDPMVIVDADDTSEDPSGTTHTISLFALENFLAEVTPTNIKTDGVQSVGTTGLIPDSDHVHPLPNVGCIVPGDSGLLAQSYPAYTATGSNLSTAGNLMLVKIPIRSPFTITSAWYNVNTAGTGTSTGSFQGIWSSSGTLLTGSSDIGSNFTTTGLKGPLAYTTPQALTTSMGFVWVGFVFNGYSPVPKLNQVTAAAANAINANVIAANYNFAVNGTSVTSLGNITPSANNQAGNAQPWWVGLT